MSNLNNPAFTLDEVGEVINLGINAAAAALSRLIGKSTEFMTPISEYVPITQIEQTGPQLPAIVAQMSCTGAVEGEYAMVVSHQDMQIVLNMLMGTDESIQPFQQTELDEISFGTIQELINQMSGAFCQTLTEFFGATVRPDSLNLQLFDNVPAISTVFPYDRAGNAVCTMFRMNIENIMSGIAMYCFSEEFAASVQQLMGSASQPQQIPPQQTAQPLPQTVVQPIPQQATPIPQQMPQQMPQQTQPARVQAATAQPVRVQPIPAQPRQRSEINVQPTRFPVFSERDTYTDSPLAGNNINLLMDVPLTVTIEIGKTRKKMRDIMEFSQGTVIGLEKQAGAPVDIVVNGQLIARGDVVVIDDNFGVRITEIVGTKDLLDKEQQ